MDFDITRYCSWGLKCSLVARGIAPEERKTFWLDMLEGMIVAYLNTLPVRFTRTFHVGCEDDGPPNFDFSIEKEGLKLVYLRVLRQGPWPVFPRDEKGTRDLELVAEQLSYPEKYDEFLGIAGPRKIVKDGYFIENVYIHVYNNQIQYISGLDLLLRPGILRQCTEKNLEGSVLDIRDRPLKTGFKRFFIRRGKHFVRGYELKQAGVESNTLISEMIKLMDQEWVGDLSLLKGLELAAEKSVQRVTAWHDTLVHNTY